MKIKHWAGYGYAEAKCTLRAPSVVVIEVVGDHEQGLYPKYFDNNDWMTWLGKRFKVGNNIDVVEARYEWSSLDRKDHMKVLFWRKV